MDTYNFFKNYIKNYGTKSKVLYLRSNNKLVNVYNYFFKRHGVLNVILKDDLCIFTLNEQNVIKMSVCFTDNFKDFKLAYRGFMILHEHGGDFVTATPFYKDADYKVARGYKKELYLNHLYKLIYGI